MPESPRPLRGDRVRNRAALLDAARAQLRLDPDAPLEAIAAAAGLTRRAVYGHFPSREALVAELATAGARRVADAAAASRHDDPVVDIALVGRLVWDDVEAVRAMTLSVVRGPLRETVLADPLAPLHRRLVEDAAAAAAAGIARDDLPPETVARLVEGAAFTALDESVRASLGREEGRRLVILAGLGALGLSWREAAALLESHAGRLLRDGDR
ncbi:TetR/AcrR family transcriptional regulator [Amnibacterium endophyticum]|uniref:TetR/AcrR family transcriptional regulator n=1 Tax=Amnibacterium endophyticum TaxID=2109337 RepID=A0ABW4LBG4_9MICO